MVKEESMDAISKTMHMITNMNDRAASIIIGCFIIILIILILIYYFYMKNPLVDRYDTLFININDNGWGVIQKNKLEIISFDIHYDLERVK